MTGRVHTVEIDRIVLNNLSVAPERAGRIRRLVEVELQSLLEREGLPDNLANGESRLSAPPILVTGSHGDNRLANNIAQNVVRALQGKK